MERPLGQRDLEGLSWSGGGGGRRGLGEAGGQGAAASEADAARNAGRDDVVMAWAGRGSALPTPRPRAVAATYTLVSPTPA